MIEGLGAQLAAELRESARLKEWAAENLAAGMARAVEAMLTALRGGGKLLFCGNGGSAADSQHLAAEFVGRFRRERAPLPALALTTDTSVLTALGNDYGFATVFARQVEALVTPGDVLVAISTSGASENVIAAVERARERGAITIGLLGRDGGELAERVDIPLVVRSHDTPHIQECHIAIGHALCAVVEQTLFGS